MPISGFLNGGARLLFHDRSHAASIKDRIECTNVVRQNFIKHDCSVGSFKSRVGIRQARRKVDGLTIFVWASVTKVQDILVVDDFSFARSDSKYRYPSHERSCQTLRSI